MTGVQVITGWPEGLSFVGQTFMVCLWPAGPYPEAYWRKF